MNDLLHTETLVIELLMLVILVAVLARKLRIPYAIGLVLIGLPISIDGSLRTGIAPELILTLFLPPLVFEAAIHTNILELRRNLPNVLALAVPGVLISTFVVGLLTAGTVDLGLPVALAFGALIGTTDPVAVAALLRQAGVPQRLASLLEGESLLNDATAIVLFNLAVGIALTGEFEVTESLLEFVRVAAGGAVTGLVLGWLASKLITQLRDRMLEVTLTMILAYGSYLLAERLEFSGVLATVVAGLVIGATGLLAVNPTTRIAVHNFWEIVPFLANSMVFLLIGLEIDLGVLVTHWTAALWAIGAVLAARIVAVYGLGLVLNRFTEPVPLRWQHVLTWGGLRGGVSLALALGLPVALGLERDIALVMTYAVVLFTLLVQGLTLPSLLRALDVSVKEDRRSDYALHFGRLASLRLAGDHMAGLARQGFMPPSVWEDLQASIARQDRALEAVLRAAEAGSPGDLQAGRTAAEVELVRAQRSALHTLRGNGIITADTFEELAAELDEQIVRQRAIESDPEGEVPNDGTR